VAARDLPTSLDVPATVRTLDALHTTKTTARPNTKNPPGHYNLIIKGNQPITRARRYLRHLHDAFPL
jgi:hypothetical protein